MGLVCLGVHLLGSFVWDLQYRVVLLGLCSLDRFGMVGGMVMVVTTMPCMTCLTGLHHKA